LRDEQHRSAADTARAEAEERRVEALTGDERIVLRGDGVLVLDLTDGVARVECVVRVARRRAAVSSSGRGLENPSFEFAIGAPGKRMASPVAPEVTAFFARTLRAGGIPQWRAARNNPYELEL